MLVQISAFDGRPLGQAELTRDDGGQVTLGGSPVLATRVIGSRTLLILVNWQVCVTTTDYVRARFAPAQASRAASEADRVVAG